METKWLPVLAACPLFDGIAKEDIPTMLDCLSARQQSYAKGQAVFLEGAPIAAVGIVLWGGVHIEQADYWGNRTILARADVGELFGEAFSCAGTQRLPVGVYAVEKTGVLLIDYRRIVTSCTAACVFHARLIQNMLRILAEKNVALTQKMETLTQCTTRDKLLACLSHQARQAGQSSFVIPFNRQQLADYLSVDRSAMSAELSRMQRDGVLQYDKNQFTLLAAARG